MPGIRKIVIYCLVLTSFSNCKRQNNGLHDGLSAFNDAKKNLDDYYKTKDDSLLYVALNNTEESIQCNLTRYEAISLKIDLLSQLKKYTWGYQFVDSLSENDFKIRYKKEMWHYYFHALESQSIGDTISRNKDFIKIISGIQNYIRQQYFPDGEDDQEAWRDLFFSKSSILNSQVFDTISN